MHWEQFEDGSSQWTFKASSFWDYLEPLIVTFVQAVIFHDDDANLLLLLWDSGTCNSVTTPSSAYVKVPGKGEGTYLADFIRSRFAYNIVPIFSYTNCTTGSNNNDEWWCGWSHLPRDPEGYKHQKLNLKMYQSQDVWYFRYIIVLFWRTPNCCILLRPHYCP